MKKISLIISLSFLLIAAASCGSYKHLQSTTNTRDSVVTIIKDSTIVRYINVDVPVPVESSSAVAIDSSHLETSVASSDASIDSLGRLHHSIRNKPERLKALVPAIEARTYRQDIASHSEMLTVRVPVEKELSGWQRFQIRGFWVLAAIAIARVIWFLAKLYLRK